MVLEITVLALLVVLLIGVATFYRIARNVGPLTLEDYARHHGVIFIPVSKQLTDELQEWSKPVQIRLDTHRHELLAELVVKEPEQ